VAGLQAELDSKQLNTAGINRPLRRPALLLDFANGRHLDSRFNFTRNSVGSYVDSDGLIKYASSNTPRFDHDPTTGESLGLLIETAKVNYALNSDLNSGWSVGVSGDTFDQSGFVKAPDGSNARGYRLSTNGGHHRLYKNLSVGQSTNCVSCFFKRADGAYNRYVEIEVSGNFTNHSAVTFDLQDMVYQINTTTYVTNPFMEEYDNGWVRCGYTCTTGNTNGHVWFGFPTTMGPDDSMGGDGEVGMYMWGAQIEADKYHTSYIPTNGSAVTRARDIPTANISDIPIKGNVTTTSVLAEGRIRWSDDHSTNYYVWDMHPASGNNKYHGVRVDGGSGKILYQTKNNTTHPSINYGSDLGTDIVDFDFKIATAIDHENNTMEARSNKTTGSGYTGIGGGVSTTTGQSGWQNEQTTFNLGGQGQPARCTWLKKIAVYETRLNTATLTTLVEE